MTVPTLPALRSFARFILENAPRYDWTLQGFGMLRLYLNRDTRLHVWHSGFAFPGVSPIHDHLQWGLTSTVIAGRMVNQRYVESETGAWFKWGTLKAGTGCYWKHEPREIRLATCEREEYWPGDTYSQRPDEIHQSRPADGTITLMHKVPAGDGESARVFWLAGTEWGSAEPRDATPAEVLAITAHALKVMDGQETVDPYRAVRQVERMLHLP